MEKLETIWQIDEIILKEIQSRSSESDYSKELDRLLVFYRKLIGNYYIYDNIPLYEYGNIKNKVYKLILNLRKLFHAIDTGDLILSSKILNRLFKITGSSSPISSCFPVANIPMGTIHYRSGTWEANERKDLFHAPFQKRGNIGPNRFSTPGYPCLYMSSSISCSFDEVVNGKSHFYVSALKNVKDIHVYDFRFYSPIFKHKCSMKDIVNCILSYPLKIAVSIPILDKDINNKYKKEYIIPELLLHCVIRQKTGSRNIGIIYTSTKAIRENISNKDFASYQNLVVPAHYFREEGFCRFLRSLFSITVPEKIDGYMGMDYSSVEKKLYSKTFEMIPPNCK